jgi:hypothetical protein
MALETYNYNNYLGAALWPFTPVIRIHEVSKECYDTCINKTMNLLSIPTVPRLYSMVDYSSHTNQTLTMTIHSTPSKPISPSIVIISILLSG